MVDQIKRTGIFKEISARYPTIDYAVPAAAIHELSRIGDMVAFYKEYTEYIRDYSDTSNEMRSAGRTAKRQVMDAIEDFCRTDDVKNAWLSVVNKTVKKSDLDRDVMSMSNLMKHLRAAGKLPYIN